MQEGHLRESELDGLHVSALMLLWQGFISNASRLIPHDRLDVYFLIDGLEEVSAFIFGSWLLSTFRSVATARNPSNDT